MTKTPLKEDHQELVHSFEKRVSELDQAVGKWIEEAKLHQQDKARLLDDFIFVRSKLTTQRSKVHEFILDIPGTPYSLGWGLMENDEECGSHGGYQFYSVCATKCKNHENNEGAQGRISLFHTDLAQLRVLHANLILFLNLYRERMCHDRLSL